MTDGYDIRDAKTVAAARALVANLRGATEAEQKLILSADKANAAAYTDMTPDQANAAALRAAQPMMAEKYPVLSDAVSPEDINAGMARRVGQLGFNAQLIPKGAMDAAVKLRDTIRARPNQRHVRIETSVDRNVNFVHTLVVSVDPSSGVAVLLSEIDGYPVRIEPWPTH